MSTFSFEDALASGNSLSEVLAESERKKEQFADKKDDPTEWYPSRANKTDNWTGIIRFLPGFGNVRSSGGTIAPYITWAQHIWKNPETNRWLYVPCLGKHVTPEGVECTCEVCKWNSKLWNDAENIGGRDVVSGVKGGGTDGQRDRGRKKQTNYMANVLVIDDLTCPENNGKVFKMRFGWTVLNKILDCNTKDPGDPKKVLFDPFNMLTGADFKLKITYDKQKGQIGYDASQFMAQTPLCGGDRAKMKLVYDSQYDLNDFYYNKLEWKTEAQVSEALRYAGHSLDIRVGNMRTDEIMAEKKKKTDQSKAPGEGGKSEPAKDAPKETPKQDPPKETPKQDPPKETGSSAITEQKKAATPPAATPNDADEVDLDALAAGITG